jgi:hypothetical protein
MKSIKTAAYDFKGSEHEERVASKPEYYQKLHNLISQAKRGVPGEETTEEKKDDSS